MGSTDTPGRHTVLAEADSGAYHSLRQRPVTRAERYALGQEPAPDGAAAVAGATGRRRRIDRTRSA